MEAVKVKGWVDEQGILRLNIPVGSPNKELEVLVVFERPRMTPEEWQQFVEKTTGILADDPIERGDQGEFEIRDEIL